MSIATPTVTQSPREARCLFTGDAPSRPVVTATPAQSTEVIKLRWEYEAKISKLEARIAELENTIVSTDSARRATERQESALTIYGEGAEVKALTDRLNVLLPNAVEIGNRGVALVAQIAIAHGLDPLPGSDHVYAWVKGGKLTVTIGYKGLLHLARQQVFFTHQTREMTADERKARNLQPGQIGYITQVWEIEKAKACKDAGIPYFPIEGEAIWSDKIIHHKKDGSTWTEYGEVPTSRDGHWVAKKNSLKDALRKITSTGVRLGQALDSMYAEMGRRAALAGMNLEATGDGWTAALPDADPEATKRELIEAGIIQAGEEDQPIVIDVPPLCLCGQPVDADGPYPDLCAVCASAKADAESASK